MTRTPDAGRAGGVACLRTTAEAHDCAAVVSNDRELRALASKLAAQANWRVAQYRAWRVKSETSGRQANGCLFAAGECRALDL